jgi:hypothetical protein
VVPLSATSFVTPGPTVIAPATVDFGTVILGGTPQQTITVTNNGTVPSVITSYTLSGSSEFTAVGGTCSPSGTTLPPAPGINSCTIIVQFTPTVTGPANGTVQVNLSGQPTLFSTLTGNGATQTYSITSPLSGSIDFGNVTVGAESPITPVTVYNNGPGTINLGTAFVGPNFKVHPFFGACTGTLNPGQSCNIGVTFDPTTGGQHSTTLVQPVTGLTSLNVVLTGFGTQPAFTVTDPDFGTIPVGQSSPSIIFNVTNVSGVAIGPFINASIGGFNAADFHIITDGCSGLVLNPAQVCQISVEFQPSLPTVEVAELIVSASGLPVVLTPLTGTGVPPTTVVVSPGPTIDFGNQIVGTTSLEKQITVHNNGPGVLAFFGPAAVLLGANANDFVIEANGCFLTEFTGGVASGGSCTVDVSFSPLVADGVGPESATLGFLDNSTTAPDNVILTGNALPAPVGLVTASPSVLNFGSVGVGIPSAPQTVTFTNNSTTTSATFGPLPASNNSGDFHILVDNCSGITLAPMQTCTIVENVTPSALGPESAALSVEVGGQPTIVVPMFVTGIAPTAQTVLPNPLDFGNQPAGTASAEQAVVVTNTGTNPLVFTGPAPTVTGPDSASFTIVGDTCTGQTIAVGLTCQYEVVFAPSGGSFGPLSASFNVVDNAGTVLEQLLGNATTAPSGIISTPSSLDFGPQGLFLPSPAMYATIKNTGGAPVTISSVGVFGVYLNDFTIPAGTDLCSGQTLNPGQTCTVTVVFTPSIIGLESAQLNVAVTGGPTLVVPLTGQGVPPATDQITTTTDPTGTGSPVSLGFPATAIGDTSAEEYVTIKNTNTNSFGNDLHVYFILTQGNNPGDFNIVSNTCSGFGRFGVAPDQVCTLGVNFAPLAPNTGNENRSADLIIKDNTNGDAQTVALSGLAVGAAISYTVTPNPVNFGSVSLGTTSAPVTETVTNTGTGVALVFPGTGDITITGTNASEFSIQNDLCAGDSVDPAGSPNNTCTVDVLFSPTATGPAHAALLFSPSNAQHTIVQLTGIGIVPGAVSFGSSAAGLEFGNVIVNTSQNVDTPPIPDPQVVTITNTSGTAALVVTSLTILGTNAADYAIVPIAGDCGAAPFTIVVFQSCQLTVRFIPSALGDRAAYINIVDNAPNSPQTISLDGTGVTAPPEQGYWLAGSDGGLYAFGAAKYFGSLAYVHLNAPIVGLASTITGKGYWMVGADGGIFTFGDAQYYGSTGAYKLNAAIVGIAATPTGHGYWIVAADGGIFSFGDAHFYGSVPGVLKPGQVLNKPIVAITKTPDGGGYLIVASDGGVFAFGDATYHGSAANFGLVKPINALVESPDGGGYLMSASDGGIFAFGNATYYGGANTLGLTIKMPIVGMSSTPDFKGYWQSANDGGVFAFGDAQFHGSIGNTILDFPPHIIAMATDPVLGPPGG